MHKSHIFPLVFVFILLNLLVPQDGGTNPMSRFTTLRAMTEQYSFKINKYKEWTVDWSQTADGNYYSNKAPGPMLLGFPLFFIIDKAKKIIITEDIDSQGRRPAPTSEQKLIISFVMQVLPFAFLCIAFAGWLNIAGYTLNLQVLFAVTFLFASTAVLFMNNYFGHGFVALFLLAMWLNLQKRKFFWVGLFYGFALLSEYSVSLLLIPLLGLLFFTQKKQIRSYLNFLAGGFLPGLLWCWYHYVCFDSVFAIANQFQNSAFKDMIEYQDNFWGVIRLTPDFSIIKELLFGAERGILVTQPWVLLFLFIKPANSVGRELYWFLIISLALLLWMNAGFGGWHGGLTAGPRYLAYLFPLMAFALIVNLKGKNTSLVVLAIACVAFSVLFRSLVYTTTILAPLTSLWHFYYQEIFNGEHIGTRLLRLLVFWMLFGMAFLLIYKKRITQFKKAYFCKAPF